MMRQVLVAAVAALALAACNQQGSGPALPPLQEGAQAPSTQTPPTGPVQRGELNDEVRGQLVANIGEQLDHYAGQFAQGMVAPQGLTDQVVALEPSTDTRWVINLTGGSLYRFIGVCDGDCTNVDIEVIDMTTGGVVASDMLPDDYPVAEFTPAADGSFMIRTLLQNCTVAPCYVGTRALVAPAGAAAPK